MSGPLPYREAAELIRSWRNPLLISHTKPDGDAIGSLVALSRLLEAAGSRSLTMNFDGIPERYSFLNRDGRLKSFGRDVSLDQLDSIDGVVVVDTCTVNQIEPLAAWIQTRRPPLVAVDHHVTRDLPATLHVIDEHAAATCLILFEWAGDMSWPIDPFTAEALFVGIGTDTGWFRHSNTDARTLAAASRLADLGARVHELSQLIYQRDTAARLRLLTSVLNTLTLIANESLAVMSLSRDAIRACGAKLSDTEDMVNEPLRIASVVASVFLVEQELNGTGAATSGNGSQPIVRVNFRSKPALLPGDRDLDVAAIAAEFGGGGHRRAAGARLSLPLNRARDVIVERMQRALADAEPPITRTDRPA